MPSRNSSGYKIRNALEIPGSLGMWSLWNLVDAQMSMENYAHFFSFFANSHIFFPEKSGGRKGKIIPEKNTMVTFFFGRTPIYIE